MPLTLGLDTYALIAVILSIVHFATPLAYYRYAKSNWFSKPWNIQMDDTHRPHLSIVVPTFDESRVIERKLGNILEDDYPHQLIEIIVVDSASRDGTAELARNWGRKHPEVTLRVVEETERKGKLHALLHAFSCLSPSSEFLIVTDADSEWQMRAIRGVAKYFADPTVAIVTTSLSYSGHVTTESTYREYYNVVRVAESKEHSSPIQSGVFQAIRTSVLTMGLPTYRGSDDSAFASYLAFAGFRSIQADDVWVTEPMRGSRFSTKLRRAQHVILNFVKTKSYARKKGVYRNTSFDMIWAAEVWLNLMNCWLIVLIPVLLILSILELHVFSALVLLIGLIAFLWRPYRMWLQQQVYLILGSFANLVTSKEIWNR